MEPIRFDLTVRHFQVPRVCPLPKVVCQPYMKSSKKVFGKKTNHPRHIRLAGKRDRDNNNKMERLNGEIVDREKIFRGLKRLDTPLIDGLKAYYNFKEARLFKGQDTRLNYNLLSECCMTITRLPAKNHRLFWFFANLHASIVYICFVLGAIGVMRIGFLIIWRSI